METFSTLRTTVKSLRKVDVPDVLKMYQEPDSFKFIAPYKDRSNEYYREFLLKKIEANKIEEGFWVVYNKEQKLVGPINLNQFMGSPITHVGCHLSNKFWNQGFAFELMTALLDYGFAVRKLEEIYAVIEESHAVSIKLFEKLNFNFVDQKMIDGSVLCF